MDESFDLDESVDVDGGDEDDILDKIQDNIPRRRPWPKNVWDSLRNLSKERIGLKKDQPQELQKMKLIELILGVYFVYAKGEGYPVEEIAELANVPVVNIMYLIDELVVVDSPEEHTQRSAQKQSKPPNIYG